MIKKLALLLIFMVLFAPINAKAADDEDKISQKVTEYKQQIDRSLEGSVDDETQQTLDKYKISAENPSAASEINISDIIKNLWERFVSALTEPLRILAKLIAICVFTVMVKSVCSDDSLGELYDTSAVLLCIIILYNSADTILTFAKSSLDDISLFMNSYIPIYSSILASNANVTSAAGYYSVMIVLCEIISFISSSVLLPFSGVVFSLNILSAINGNTQLGGICTTIKNAVKWVLTVLMMIFTAIISLKGITGAAADTLASKTIRFAASSFIPIVGSSVSEAYSTIYGSLGIIRSGVGFLGIAAVAVIALRPLITIAAFKLVITIAAVVNDLFDQKRTSQLLSGLNSVLSIVLGIVTAMSMIFVISTAVIMLTSIHTV